MELRLRFKGTPYQFAGMSFQYEALRRKQKSRDRLYVRFSDRLYPETNRVEAYIVVPNSQGETKMSRDQSGKPIEVIIRHYLNITAIDGPGGISWLFVESKDEDWNELQPYWQLFLDEMRAQRWIEEEPAAIVDSAQKPKAQPVHVDPGSGSGTTTPDYWDTVEQRWINPNASWKLLDYLIKDVLTESVGMKWTYKRLEPAETYCLIALSLYPNRNRYLDPIATVNIHLNTYNWQSKSFDKIVTFQFYESRNPPRDALLELVKARTEKTIEDWKASHMAKMAQLSATSGAASERENKQRALHLDKRSWQVEVKELFNGTPIIFLERAELYAHTHPKEFQIRISSSQTEGRTEFYFGVKLRNKTIQVPLPSNHDIKQTHVLRDSSVVAMQAAQPDKSEIIVTIEHEEDKARWEGFYSYLQDEGFFTPQLAKQPSAPNVAGHIDAKASPSWFPKTPQKQEQWREASACIEKIEEQYRKAFSELREEKPNPSNADLADALIKVFKRKPTERTVSNIKRARKMGLLVSKPKNKGMRK